MKKRILAGYKNENGNYNIAAFKAGVINEQKAFGIYRKLKQLNSEEEVREYLENHELFEGPWFEFENIEEARWNNQLFEEINWLFIKEEYNIKLKKSKPNAFQLAGVRAFKLYEMKAPSASYGPSRIGKEYSERGVQYAPGLYERVIKNRGSNEAHVQGSSAIRGYNEYRHEALEEVHPGMEVFYRIGSVSSMPWGVFEEIEKYRIENGMELKNSYYEYAR